LTDLQIVGVGLSTVDVLIRLKEMPTFEMGGRMSGFALQGGGPVATAMVAAARLGARAGYVGVAGSDETGEMKVRGLSSECVDVSNLVRRPGPEKHIVCVYVHEETGERTFCGMRDRSADWPLRPEELNRDYVTSAPYLHLDGLGSDAGMQAARWAREAGRTVVFDGAKVTSGERTQLGKFIGLVDVLIGGSGFVPALTGETDWRAAGKKALAMGPRIVVQTEGDQGSFTMTADDEFHVPAFKVPVLDTTGAGDVFHGAYIVGLLQDWDLRRVALFSTAVSALKCGKLGGRAGIPSFAETLAFLQEREPEACFR
jgi:sulfofructose kinase